MENAGWKVIKLKGDTNLTSRNTSNKDINFVQSIKNVFGEIGLPDFLVIKNNDCGFVEVKYKGDLTKQQANKIKQLESYLGIWTYIIKKPTHR